MKKAECICAMCGLRFQILFDDITDVPPYTYMTCPICASSECKVNWIMRNGDE